jgi:large subunit ribosomal protein L21
VFAVAASQYNRISQRRGDGGHQNLSMTGHGIAPKMRPYNGSHDILCYRNLLSSNHRYRCFSSKYISVDHSAAYRDAMSGSHGTQLQLALEEGRGKDDAPFDPFSQFLDEMGSTMNDVDDDEEEEDGDDEEEIEEAEYKTIENYENSNGLQVNDDDDLDDESESIASDGGSTNRLRSNNPTYTTTGALYRPKSERLALRAGYPAGGNFAVISLAGFQHKVTVDDLLVVNKLKPISAWSVGSTHTIKDSNILLLANQDKTLVGLPGVMGGEVNVMVEEITRDKTLIIFKKRRRKNSRRKNGFRRQVTFLRVLDVRMPGEMPVVEMERTDGSTMDEDVVKVAA